MKTEGFIERHGLWTDIQSERATRLSDEIEKHRLHLIRVVWADPHGAARAKSLSVEAFRDMLVNGYNINVATSTLDGSGGRVFTSFIRGGGMDLDEMTGSPNLVIVPDPETFRILPWARRVGWILCDEYFRSGIPFHFSSRHLLRRQVRRLEASGFVHRIGLEVEWYVARVTQERLTADNTGLPGRRGRPVETAPVEPGYSYHSETNLDLIQPIFDQLAWAYGRLDLGFRSLENEYGPGQVETTFAARDAMRAADDYVLFRTATRQVCRRHGYFATFMCQPALENHFPSGWHLHQSLVGKNDGVNRFTPSRTEALSETGRQFLAGLLTHALPATVFATPTVNGYRRFRPNSLAPDRVTWCSDHRGALMRVIGGADDPSSRIENRAGEPAANPYLFIASQIVAGLDGMEHASELQPEDDAPYEADRPRLPENLGKALEALNESALFREAFGDVFMDYYLRLKAAEWTRYRQAERYSKHEPGEGPVSQWEQNEYYDFF